MNILDVIRNKYSLLPFNEVSFGFTSIMLFPCEEINDVINDKFLIIGYEDLCGDHLCVDITSKLLPVYIAPLDGDLSIDCVSASFDNFVEILKVFNELSIDRDNPKKLENNPVPEDLKKKVLNQIRISNPGCEMYFWEGLFEV
jgi:hypothetical protein